MRVDLEPRSITLRAMEAADLTAAHGLTAAIGWPYRREDWRFLFELGAGHVACSGDRVAGTAMRWRHGDVATVGLVLVAGDCQGRGIGRQLMQAALASLGDAAVQLHATQAGLPLYETLGFRAAGVVHQHEGVLEAALPAADACIRAARASDLPAMLALDEEGFGVARVALLDRLLARSEGWVLERDGCVQGVALRRRFGRGLVIGPVLAADEDDAIALIACALQDGGGNVQRVDIPAAASRLGEWLGRLGVRRVDSAVTMLRGPWPRPGQGARRFALVSQALG